MCIYFQSLAKQYKYNLFLYEKINGEFFYGIMWVVKAYYNICTHPIRIMRELLINWIAFNCCFLAELGFEPPVAFVNRRGRPTLWVPHINHHKEKEEALINFDFRLRPQIYNIVPCCFFSQSSPHILVLILASSSK